MERIVGHHMIPLDSRANQVAVKRRNSTFWQCFKGGGQAIAARRFHHHQRTVQGTIPFLNLGAGNRSGFVVI
jgi:hypothetical protein